MLAAGQSQREMADILTVVLSGPGSFRERLDSGRAGVRLGGVGRGGCLV